MSIILDFSSILTELPLYNFRMVHRECNEKHTRNSSKFFVEFNHMIQSCELKNLSSSNALSNRFISISNFHLLAKAFCSLYLKEIASIKVLQSPSNKLILGTSINAINTINDQTTQGSS